MSFSPHPSILTGCSSIQEQRDRWERKRSRTAKELVKTEQHYCQQLELVTTFFVEILKAKGTLKQDIREGIFSTIKDIHSVNQKRRQHKAKRRHRRLMPSVFMKCQVCYQSL